MAGLFLQVSSSSCGSENVMLAFPLHFACDALFTCLQCLPQVTAFLNAKPFLHALTVGHLLKPQHVRHSQSSSQGHLFLPRGPSSQVSGHFWLSGTVMGASGSLLDRVVFPGLGQPLEFPAVWPCGARGHTGQKRDFSASGHPCGL
jgi:hypothetical protein